MNAIHYEEMEDQQAEIKPLVQDEHKDTERKLYGWKGEVKIDSNFDSHCDTFIWTMTEFVSILSNHFGGIDVAKHGIELTSDVTRQT